MATKLNWDIFYAFNNYMLAIIGDFNYPLQKDVSYIDNYDPHFDNIFS